MRFMKYEDSIERTNKELSKWVEGRILTRVEGLFLEQ